MEGRRTGGECESGVGWVEPPGPAFGRPALRGVYVRHYFDGISIPGHEANFARSFELFAQLVSVVP